MVGNHQKHPFFVHRSFGVPGSYAIYKYFPHNLPPKKNSSNRELKVTTKTNPNNKPPELLKQLTTFLLNDLEGVEM